MVRRTFLIVAALFLTITLAGWLVSAKSNFPKSDHFNGKTFFNPNFHGEKGFFDLLKWQLTADRATWPEKIENKNYPRVELKNQKAVFTFIGHATYLIQTPGVTILTDPHFSERASPVGFAGPKRVRRPGIEIDQLPKIDVVLISHNHYDHLDVGSLKTLHKNFHPLFLVPLGDKELLENEGIDNVQEMDWWQDVLVKETKISFVPTHHWSARGFFDKCESLWGGYFITTSNAKFYFGGDSGYDTHFTQTREKLGSPDLSLIPIGAYEPRWFMKEHHMNPEEAVQAHLDLESKLSLGIHLMTFQLTDEAFDAPVQALELAKSKLSNPQSFRVLDVGESLAL